jgi:hypothetical protein
LYFATNLKLFNQNDDFEWIFLYFCAKETLAFHVPRSTFRVTGSALRVPRYGLKIELKIDGYVKKKTTPKVVG